jgi:hypothetical protein
MPALLTPTATQSCCLKEEEEDIVAEVARLRAEAADRQKQMEDMQQL